MKKKILLGIFCLWSCVFVKAQTWDGSASTDWNTPANWSTNTVPTSTGAVIIPVPGVITNWPVLANDVSISSLTMNSGSQLNTAGFNITLGAGTGCDITEALVTNPVPANTTLITVPAGGTNLNGNTFNGNFHFSTSSFNQTTGEATTAANTWNGNTTFTVDAGETLSLSVGFASTFNGNLTVNKPFNAADAALANMLHAGAIITGNFTLNFDDESRLWVGTLGNPIRIGGQLNMNINNVASSLQLYSIKNATDGGTIVINNVDVNLTIAQDSFKVNTVNITQINNTTTTFDSNYIKGSFTFNHTIASSNQTITVRNTIFDGDVNITTADANFAEGNVQRCYYLGNATFSTTSGAITLSNSDTSWFYKNLTVNTTSGLNIKGAKFVGSTNSIFEQLGTQPVSMGRLIMEKTGGARLTLNDSVAITTSVGFTSGNIYTTTNNNLRFNNLIGYTGSNDSSHVVGPVQKVGNITAAPFTFPVGTDTTLNNVTMSNHGSSTAIFSAAYLKMNPSLAGYDTSLHAGTLQRISGCEYWDIQRLNGTSNVTLTFSFAEPCSGSPDYISNPAFVRIARWTGATWEDLGNGGSTGTTTGTVTTAGPVTNFSPFTFGSTDITINPLPVTLLRFTASRENEKTKLSWQTTDEINSSRFEVQRSIDGINYLSIASIAATNMPGSYDYMWIDQAPVKGINYYRLKMVDIDERFKLSQIAKVDFRKNITIAISPNPASGEVIIQSDKKITGITLIDMNGRIVKQFVPSANNRYNISTIRAGIYFVRVSVDEFTESVRLIVQ